LVGVESPPRLLPFFNGLHHVLVVANLHAHPFFQLDVTCPPLDHAGLFKT
jgi:hypothetical protein